MQPLVSWLKRATKALPTEFHILQFSNILLYCAFFRMCKLFRFSIISQLVLTGYSVQVVALATIIGIDAGLCCMERRSPTTRIPRLWSLWTPLIWVPLGACVQWSNATAIGLQALIAACALGWQWMEEHSTYWQTMKKIAGAFDMGGKAKYVQYAVHPAQCCRTHHTIIRLFWPIR